MDIAKDKSDKQLKRVKQDLENLALSLLDNVKNNSNLVVGLSGGPDSTLALLVAKQACIINKTISIKAVHCIHGLDADDPFWLEHCQKLCQSIEVPLITPRLNIIYGNGKSPEEISREQRYNAIIDNTDENSYIVLGHQLDDQIENFFLAFKRGSGPHGLSGMRDFIEDNRGRILRPLLSLKKIEIENMLNTLGISYTYDISNSYMKFERNFIRLQVLPLLKTRFKGIEKSILKSMYICQITDDLALRYAKEHYHRVKKDNYIDLKLLACEDHNLLIYILRLFIQEHLHIIAELNILLMLKDLAVTDNQRHGLIEYFDHIFYRHQDRIYITKRLSFAPQGQYTLSVDETLTLGDFTYKLVKKTDTANCFLLSDKEVILDFAYNGNIKLKVVNRAKSREIRKLISQEYKIPLYLRASIPLVVSVKKDILAIGNIVSVNNTNGNYALEIECIANR